MANKTKLRKWIILLIITGLPALASAEFYRYVDRHGKVRFTDNLANVPADQRSQVDEYEEFPHRSSQEEKPEIEGQGVAREEADQQAEAVPAPKESLLKKEKKNIAVQKLKETGARLREEYEDLMEERDQLDKAATMRLTPSARRKLVEKIKDFNARIKDYEERREAYNKEVEVHNASTKNGG